MSPQGLTKSIVAMPAEFVPTVGEQSQERKP
jgi:hypothetical protein